MNPRLASYLLAGSLLLVGAGCAPSAPSESPADSAPVDTSAQVDAAKDAVADLTKTLVDDTWQKYTNSALNFSFDWPTKGRYAPRWEVKFLEDAQVKDGCLANELMTTRKVMAGDQEFCHSTGEIADNEATDYYVTKVGSRHVAIVFSKDSSGAGSDFSWDEYRAHLDQIVSTFKLAK